MMIAKGMQIVMRCFVREEKPDGWSCRLDLVSVSMIILYACTAVIEDSSPKYSTHCLLLRKQVL